MRNIWWNSNSSNLKKFSSSSFPISRLCDRNAETPQFLQNNSNQTILSNCITVLTNKVDTFTFASLQTNFHDNSVNSKKLNFYQANKITSDTQADVLSNQQNDVNSTTSFNENKNKLDDCNQFASASTQTKIRDKTSMSSTEMK